MATLTWDEVGERIYQTGIDHGVLYLHDGTAVAWNGLINVEDSIDSELKVFYLDGVKYLQNLIPGDFQAKLKAFTYPQEFDKVNGLAEVAPGLMFDEQPSKSFNLAYRTKVGNDIEGDDFGYKIHILYNVFAKPEAVAFGTTQESGIQAVEFGWTLTGTPEKVDRYKPTVHLTIDSRTTPDDVLQLIENILYGTESSNPSLPSMQDVAEIFGYLGALIIIDHGDGSWSAIDESDTYITMIDLTTFQIDDADTVILDPDTYTISSTNVDN